MTDDVTVREPSKPVYLGDGLYAEFDGWQIKLYAHNGLDTTNTVYLEPGVLHSFLEYVRQLQSRPIQHQHPEETPHDDVEGKS